jgi:hypothetical protein
MKDFGIAGHHFLLLLKMESCLDAVKVLVEECGFLLCAAVYLLSFEGVAVLLFFHLSLIFHSIL